MEVAHVGVRTRARALTLGPAAKDERAKRRKVGGGELEFSSSLVPIRSPRGVAVAPENTVSPATSEGSGRQTVSDDRWSSPSSDHAPASCCSSNASSDLEKGSLKIVDLEDDCVQLETSTCVFDCSASSKETSPWSWIPVESGELEPTATVSEANSRRRLPAEEMPSETELEEFFAAAEKDLQKQFTEKYNFDIAKDVPLEGRYEWVRLKP